MYKVNEMLLLFGCYSFVDWLPVNKAHTSFLPVRAAWLCVILAMRAKCSPSQASLPPSYKETLLAEWNTLEFVWWTFSTSTETFVICTSEPKSAKNRFIDETSKGSSSGKVHTLCCDGQGCAALYRHRLLRNFPEGWISNYSRKHNNIKVPATTDY